LQRDAEAKFVALQSILDRAEIDIRAKSDAILTNNIESAFTTLPAIKDRPRDKSLASTTPTQRSVREDVSRQKMSDLLANPTSAAARQLLSDRYGIAAPSTDRIVRAAGKKTSGRVVKEKVSVPVRCPPPPCVTPPPRPTSSRPETATTRRRQPPPSLRRTYRGYFRLV
jgi:hypothetical protein